MKKLDLIKKKYEDAQINRVALQAVVDELAVKIKQLESSAQENAEAGDLEGYTAAKDELRRVDDEIHVKQMQIEKTYHPLTEEEVRDAWLQYTKKADEELAAAWSEYEKARNNLADRFKALMKMQEDRLKIRKQCAKYLSKDISAAVALAPTFKCYLIMPADVSHDLQYFFRLGISDREEHMKNCMISSGSSSI